MSVNPCQGPGIRKSGHCWVALASQLKSGSNIGRGSEKDTAGKTPPQGQMIVRQLGSWGRGVSGEL